MASDFAIGDSQLELGEFQFPVSRPHSFGLVIDGPPSDASDDYLHDILLTPENREAFLTLIDDEGLVVCKNVRTDAPSYRKVRGKSSGGKLSQAEYYHHDGCSCPTNPRVVEIRLPHQDIERHVATAIAWFPDVIRAMLLALPERLKNDSEIENVCGCSLGKIPLDRESNGHASSNGDLPSPETWDKVQGRVTRLVRREMDAESCRAYFRNVDQIAGAYVLPWEMGESRLMVNSNHDLAKTMQHRRAYQEPRAAMEQNGSLAKRWTAEEV